MGPLGEMLVCLLPYLYTPVWVMDRIAHHCLAGEGGQWGSVACSCWCTAAFVLLVCGLSFSAGGEEPLRSRGEVVEIDKVSHPEVWFRLVCDYGGFGCWVMDHPSGLLDWDDRMHGLLQLEGEHVAPVRVGFLALLESEERAEILRGITGSIERSDEYVSTFTIARGGFGTRHFEIRCRGFSAGDHGGGRAIGICRDITEQIKSAEAWATMPQDFQAMSGEARGFLCAATHDLKSPLLTMKGYISSMLRDLQDGKTAGLGDQVIQVKRAVERMWSKVDYILNLSHRDRMESGRERVSVREVLDGVLVDLSDEVRRANAGIDSDLQVEYLHAAEQGLCEILQNLIDNALRYGLTESSRLIEVGTRREGDEIWLTVRDRGRGIAPESHARIFELFHREDTNRDGSGIGLALVREIVERHGGRVWVESDVGRGATFFVSFPSVGEAAEG